MSTALVFRLAGDVGKGQEWWGWMMKSNDDGKDKVMLAQWSQSWLGCTIGLV